MKHSNTPIRLTAISLALTLGLSACGKSPEAHFQEGQKLIQQANYKSAVLELKTVLQEQPANREARLLLGQAQYHMGAYAAAVKELGKARDLGATEDQVLPLLAMAQLRMGERQKVLDLTIPVSGLSPRSLATLHTARAEALLATGKRPEAETAIATAKQSDAKLPDLLLLQAKLAISDKHQDQAAQLVDTALQENPKLTEALYLKAALIAKDKLEEAIKIYQQIIANDPSQFRAHLATASLQLKKGNVDAADQAIQAAEKVAGQAPMVKYARGTLELQRGKLDKASSALLDVLRVAPDHLPSMLAYAMASYGLGHYDQSMKNAGKVLGAVPDNLIAAKILAGSQLKVGEAKAALKTLDPFLPKYPNDAKLLALAGEIYLQSKDYNKAMGYLDKAAELDPENATIKTRQAAGHLATGDSNEALADLEKAASLSEKPGQADLALVMLHMKDKAYDKALQAIASLEKKLPNNPVTHNLRAAALLGKQDKAGARKALEQALAIQPGFFPASVNLARLDMQDKNPDAARKRFESVLAADKTNVKAMLALADLAASEKKEKDSVDWLEKATKADPKALQAHAGLVRHYLAKKENAKALTQARQAVNADPENLAALNLLGATQMATGDKNASIDTYTKVTQKAPQSPQALLRLAIAQVSDKQFGPARTTLKNALQIKPDFLLAQDAMIRLELADNKPEVALQIARQIQEKNAKSPLGFDREGDIQLYLKRYPLATKAYEQAHAKAGSSQSFIKLHQTVRLAGNVKEADKRLNAWLSAHPQDMLARSYAAEAFLNANRNREAIAQYEIILKTLPKNPVVLNNLADLYHKEKDARALPTAEQALQLAPDHPGIMDTLGWILLDQGQTPRAITLLRKAVDKAPKAGVLRYHLAVALNKSGDKPGAKKELEAAIASGQNFPELESAKTMLKSL